MSVTPRADEDERSYRQLFDRSSDYAELCKAWKDANRGLGRLSPLQLSRLQRKLQREFDAVRGTDFCPAAGSVETEAAPTKLIKRIESLPSPDEPHEVDSGISRLDPAQYRGRRARFSPCALPARTGESDYNEGMALAQPMPGPLAAQLAI